MTTRKATSDLPSSNVRPASPLDDSSSSRDPQTFESKGKHRNIKQSFQVVLTGKEIYDICKILEDRATEARGYLDIRASVLAAETLRERAKQAGF